MRWTNPGGGGDYVAAPDTTVSLAGIDPTGVATSTVRLSVDLTSTVQAWRSGLPDHGLVVVPGTEQLYWYASFHSRESALAGARPNLTVTYRAPAAAPRGVAGVRLGACATCVAAAAADVQLDEASPTAKGVLQGEHRMGDADGGGWIVARFDTSSIPAAATVRAARLRVFLGSGAWPWDEALRVHAITGAGGAWDPSSVSFRYRSGSTPWTASGGDLSSALGPELLRRFYDPLFYQPGPVHSDVWELPAAVVQRWVSDPPANAGLAIRGVTARYADDSASYVATAALNRAVLSFTGGTAYQPTLELRGWSGTGSPSVKRNAATLVAGTHYIAAVDAGRLLLALSGTLSGGDTLEVADIPPPCPAIAIAPSALPAARKGKSYSQVLTASGGTAPYAFTLSSGSLPKGLKLSASGTLSGTARTPGTFSFTVKATDAKGCAGTRSYTLAVS